jgi:cytochrome b pre-mRNA-processing protein 3
MGWLGFRQRARHERAGHELYAAAVAAAREPCLYTDLGVPDTLDGRFDLVGLYVFLLIHRLAAERALAQAVFDAMFADMDVNLREMGVGDLSVGKRVKAMWEAFHGRAVAYQQAMAAGDWQALAAALARNVWRGSPPADASDRLARLMRAQAACLDGQTLAALAAGDAGFLPAAEALR